MSKKNQESSGKGSAQKKWADRATVSENPDHTKITLYFSTEPHPELQSKLRAMGFKPDKWKLNWFANNTKECSEFATSVQSSITTSVLGPDLALAPSFSPVKTNIEKKDFSFVLVSLKNSETKNYIIFEPSKPRAEVIATRFAREQFGENFQVVAVKPRVQIKEAKILFDEGKIITGESNQSPEPMNYQNKTENKTDQSGKILLREILLTTKKDGYTPLYKEGKAYSVFSGADLYAKSLVGKYSDVYFKIIWQDGSTHEGSIDLEPPDFYGNKENIVSAHVENYFSYLAKQYPNVLYPKKEIERAKQIVNDYQFKEPETPASRKLAEKNARNLKIYQQILDDRAYFEEHIQHATPEQLDEEIRRKFRLNERQGKIDSPKKEESEEEETSAVEATTESESEENNPLFKKAFILLNQFIPGLIPKLQSIDKEKSNFKISEFIQGERKIELWLERSADQHSYISLEDYKSEKEELQSSILIDFEKKEAQVSAEWLSDAYAGRYDRLKSEEEMEEADEDIGEEMTRGLTEWLDDVLALGYHIDLQGHIIDLSKEESESEESTERENKTYYQLAYIQLQEVIPDFVQHLKNGARTDVGIYVTEKEGKIIKIDYQWYRKIGNPTPNYDISLTELNEKEDDEALFDITVDLKEQQAIVYSDFLANYYRMRYNRELSDSQLEAEGKDIIEERTRTLCAWLQDLIEENVQIEVTHNDKQIQKKEESKKEALALERPIFNAVTMAKLIAQDTYLSAKWSIDEDLNILKENSFSKEQTNHLNAFFGVYVLEDVMMEKKYRQIYDSTTPFVSEEKNTNTNPKVELSVKALAKDLQDGDIFLPNVLIPVGLKEPFITQRHFEYDLKKLIKKELPDLFKFTDDNLSEANALEMLYLIKMSHPNDYGLSVSRSPVLHEWERRGRKLFEELGYPTDDNYPYANLYSGYTSIETLEEKLFDGNREGDEWWAVADNCFPIADLQKALEIIDQLSEKYDFEKEGFINPKTGKPKGEYKDKYRDIEFRLKDLAKSKKVILNYIDYLHPNKHSEDETIEPKDPLTNDNGEFTEQTAGKKFERIIISMPKGAKYSAEIRIAKTSQGDYRKGVSCMKNFGDYNGMSYAPGQDDEIFLTRQEALTSALKEIKKRLKGDLETKDASLDSEESKMKSLNMAMKALHTFAIENEINLETISEPEPGIIKGLENTYWTEADNGYPVDKAIIKGMQFHQARLRQAITEKLEKLPIVSLMQITDELSHRFKERNPLDTYEKGLITRGKTGDKRTATVIASYVDDMIIDNDLRDDKDYPVMTFLLELLFDGSQKLVDLPQEMEKRSVPKIKKQSQHELNQEIEALIDKKDKGSSSFDAEEKNFIRLYTGSGGLLKEGASGRGVLYEYYTPDIVVRKMWGMAFKYGYDGGSVLEPAVGTGNFLKYAPKEANVFGYETNHYSARIAQILYPSKHFHIHEKAFETLFFAGNIHLKDDFDHPSYSLIIGNPPYGEFTGKYAGMGEKKWTGALEYDQYFILRGLDLLKNDGLLIFVVPNSFLDYNIKSAKVKEKIAAKADLLNAYRLPIRTFNTTDIGTDIVLFKKK